MPDPVITPTELADLREATESWFTDRCDIWRPAVSADDAYGGYGNASADTLVVEDIHCAIESGAEHEQTRALIAKIQSTQVFTVILPAGTDVRLHDHLIITTQGNDRLRVQAVISPESWEIERRVLATEFE